MDFSRLDEYMDRIVSEYDVPGADCIIYKGHEMVYRKYVGMRDRENAIPMDGSELYMIFSMTKMLTCVSALQLMEKGKFLLSDPVSKFLPEYARMRISSEENDSSNASDITTGGSMGESANVSSDGYALNTITMRDLFTMSAGLDYDIGAVAIKEYIAQGKTSTRELVEAISKTVLGFEPGTRYRYSLCHDVIGAVIEVISGQKLGDYMYENIFAPLGMKNTFFGIPKDEERRSRLAALYRYDENRKAQRVDVTCPYNLSDDYQSGGAGLASCTEDYAIFLDAMANMGTAKNGYRLISPASVKLMSTNHLKDKQYDDFQNVRKGYGYGLGVRTHMDRSISGSLSSYGEFGWDGAAGAYALADPEKQLAISYFQHVHNWDIRLQNELRNIVYACID